MSRRSIACAVALGLSLSVCAWAQVPVTDPGQSSSAPRPTQSTQPVQAPTLSPPVIQQAPVQRQTTPSWNPDSAKPADADVPTRVSAPPPKVEPVDEAPPKTPAETAASVKLGDQPLTMLTRMTLIRGLNAEFVFSRLTFPFSEKGLTLKAGTARVTPDGMALKQELVNKGAAAHPGDKGQITGIEIRDKSIVFELNGGPKKKTKWYQRISVGGAGGETPIAPGPDNSMAHGSLLYLEFDRSLPEMTVEQVKQLLAPAFDFSSRTATASYADMMPPKVRKAIKDHQALVGMNHEMVTAAKGRPEQKIRERDQTNGDDYEEWVYGHPPQEVAFVRFVGDEVTQVKTMTVDGQRVVHTAREVDFPEGQVPGTASAVLAQTQGGEGQPGAQQPGDLPAPPNAAPTSRPTLKRPGEASTQEDPLPSGTVVVEKRLPGAPQQRQPSSDPSSPGTPGTQLPGSPLPPPAGPPTPPGQGPPQ